MKRRGLIAGLLLTAALSAGFWIRQSQQQPQLTPEELFQTALTSLNTGGSEGVEEAFRRLPEEQDYKRHLAVLDAVLFLRGGRPEEAIRRLAPIPVDSPVRELSLLYAGQALYEVGRLAESQQLFRVLRSEYPENLDARRWLGAIYFDLGAYDAAIAEMQAVAEQAKDDFRPHHLLGVMYQEFELADEAARHFRQALELRPPEATAVKIRQELAAVLIHNRQYAEALDILELLPESTPVLELIAECYWNQGDPNAAETRLQMARDAGLLNARGRLLEAQIAEASGSGDRAIRILEDAVDQFPGKVELRYQLAMTLQQQGDTQRAAEELAVWEQQRELADQLVQLNLQAVSEPNNAEVRDQLAEISRQLGREQLAEMWERAAAACRNNSSVLEVAPAEAP